MSESLYDFLVRILIDKEKAAKTRDILVLQDTDTVEDITKHLEENDLIGFGISKMISRKIIANLNKPSNASHSVSSIPFATTAPECLPTQVSDRHTILEEERSVSYGSFQSHESSSLLSHQESLQIEENGKAQTPARTSEIRIKTNKLPGFSKNELENAISTMSIKLSDQVQESTFIKEGLELLNKIKNTFIMSSQLSLQDFFKQGQKDKAEYDSMINDAVLSTTEGRKFPFFKFAYFLFHKVARQQSLDVFVRTIKCEYIKKNIDNFLITNRKILIIILLANSDEELRVQLLLILSQYCPLPLRYPSLTESNPEKLQYTFLKELYWVMQPMPAMLCILLSSSMDTWLINKLYGTSFDEITTFFDYGAVDIQYDFNYKPPGRGFSVLKTDGVIKEADLVPFIKFSSMFTIVVDIDFLKKSHQKLTDCLEMLIKTSEEYSTILLIIKGGDKPTYPSKEMSDSLQEQYNLAKFNQLFIVKVQSENVGAGDDSYLQIIKERLILEIQQMLETRKSKAKNHQEFLKIFSIDHFKEENDIIEDFMQHIQINSDNFYNDNFIPMYIRYRKHSQIHHKTLNDPEVLNNHEFMNDLCAEISSLQYEMNNKEKLKPTKIFYIFMSILSFKNSFILQFALSKRIKEFTQSRTEQDAARYYQMGHKYQELRSSQEVTKQHEAKKLYEELNNFEAVLENKFISLEIMWRELAQFYCYQKDIFKQIESSGLEIIFGKYTSRGLPFEILDGDNIKLPYEFIKAALPEKHNRWMFLMANLRCRSCIEINTL